MGVAPAKAKGDGVGAVPYTTETKAGQLRGVTLFQVALFADDDDGHEHASVLELWRKINEQTLALGQVRCVAEFKSRAQRAFKRLGSSGSGSNRGSGNSSSSGGGGDGGDSASGIQDVELCSETAARSVARLMILLICDPASKKISSVAQGALSLYNRERPLAVTVAAARVFADLYHDLQSLTSIPAVGLAGKLADALRALLRQSSVRRALGAGTARALVRYAFAELGAATPAALLGGGGCGDGGGGGGGGGRGEDGGGAGGRGTGREGNAVLRHPSEAVDGALTLAMIVYSVAREAAVNECGGGGEKEEEMEIAKVELLACLAYLGCSEEEARAATIASLSDLFQPRRVVLEALLSEVAWSKDVHGKAAWVFRARSL